MQFVYRGSAYDSISSEIHTPDLEITGQYRGAPVTFHAPVGISQPHAVAKLVYRGNPYLRFRG